MRGLVLAGGGTKGSYQVGVWKALRELDVDINVVCGTSIGAFNGAMFAMQQFSKAYHMWSHMTLNDMFKADESLIKAYDDFMREKKIPTSLAVYKDLFNYIRQKGGVDVTPLRDKVERYLDEDLLRNSPIDYGLVTFNVDKLKPVRAFADEIPEGELKHYIIGSAMVPGFAREEGDPIRFVDGGIYDNFPIKMAIDRGCEEVIAVSLSDVKRKKWGDTNVIYIQPREPLGNFLHLDKERTHRSIRMGYLDTLVAFNELTGKEFYFKNMPNEKEAFQQLVDLPYENKNEINKLIFDKELLNERYFFEKTIYKLSRMLDLDMKASYDEIILTAYERIMFESDLEKVDVYSPIKLKRHFKNVEPVKNTKIYRLLLNI